jgi:hypothetical protein
MMLKMLGCASALMMCFALPALAFHGGHTGVTEDQLKAACPAFRTGVIDLSDSVSPPGNLPMTDVFVHESGARCSCTRQRTDVRSMRCGPMAAMSPKSVSASSRPVQP